METSSNPKASRFRFRAWNLREPLTQSKPLNEMKYFSLKEAHLFIGGIIKHTIVMQSTGLTDKNGKEIFEGDVVKFYDDYTTQIKWDSRYCGWLPWVGNIEGFDTFDEYHCFVIGNIYESPELLR